MEVTVWSLLGGDSSGHLKFTLPPTFSIGDLLKLYCLEKGVTLSKDLILRGKGNAGLDPLKSLAEEEVANGETVMLTRSEKKQRLCAFGSWWVISALAFLIGILGLAYTLFLFCGPHTIPNRYGLVIDAGSTHSTLFVFSWSENKPLGTGEVKLEHSCFMPGGIAMFLHRKDDLANYLMPCINEAEVLIPDDLQPGTSLTLAATAGMRILRYYDEKSADLVLSAIRNVFWSETNFMTRYQDVFIASGQEEGINGWTALNYLLEKFQPDASDDDKNSDDSTESVSALDLGGASMQVTTELSKNHKKWPTVNMTIFNSTYQIYSKSFLCYGITEALVRYQYLLVHKFGRKHQRTFHDPCMSKGNIVELTKINLTDPCTYSDKSSERQRKLTDYSNKNMRDFYDKYIYINDKKTPRLIDDSDKSYMSVARFEKFIDDTEWDARLKTNFTGGARNRKMKLEKDIDLDGLNSIQLDRGLLQRDIRPPIVSSHDTSLHKTNKESTKKGNQYANRAITFAVINSSLNTVNETIGPLHKKGIHLLKDLVNLPTESNGDPTNKIDFQDNINLLNDLTSLRPKKANKKSHKTTVDLPNPDNIANEHENSLNSVVSNFSTLDLVNESSNYIEYDEFIKERPGLFGNQNTKKMPFFKDSISTMVSPSDVIPGITNKPKEKLNISGETYSNSKDYEYFDRDLNRHETSNRNNNINNVENLSESKNNINNYDIIKEPNENRKNSNVDTDYIEVHNIDDNSVSEHYDPFSENDETNPDFYDNVSEDINPEIYGEFKESAFFEDFYNSDVNKSVIGTLNPMLVNTTIVGLPTYGPSTSEAILTDSAIPTKISTPKQEPELKHKAKPEPENNNNLKQESEQNNKAEQEPELESKEKQKSEQNNKEKQELDKNNKAKEKPELKNTTKDDTNRKIDKLEYNFGPNFNNNEFPTTSDFPKTVIYPNKEMIDEPNKQFHGPDNEFGVKNNYKVYTFKGTSNNKLCRKRVKSLFDYGICSQWFMLGDCLTKNRIPHQTGKLIGFSAIFKKILPLLGIDKGNTLDDFRRAVLQICSLSALEIRTYYPDVPQILQQQVCFDSMYVYNLLTDGLGITQKRWRKLRFINKVNTNEIEWALGLMLNRTSYLPADFSNGNIDLLSFISLCILFVAFLLISMVFLCHGIKLKREEMVYQRVLDKYTERPTLIEPVIPAPVQVLPKDPPPGRR